MTIEAMGIIESRAGGEREGGASGDGLMVREVIDG
jgi:hypothetical protein